MEIIKSTFPETINVESYDEILPEVIKFYDFILPKYDSIFPGYSEEQEKLARSLHQLFRKNGAKRIVDISFGTGFLLEKLAFLDPSYELFGFDASNAAINLAEERFKKRGLNIAVQRADWLRLSGYRSSFDAVICLGNSLAHLPTNFISPVLSIFSTLLRPLGLLICDTYTKEEWDLALSESFIPRGLTKRGHEIIMVAFTDKIASGKNYTLKTVSFVYYGNFGAPKKIESFEIIQYFIFPHQLFSFIKEVKRFDNIKKLNLGYWPDRFYIIEARKKSI